MRCIKRKKQKTYNPSLCCMFSASRNFMPHKFCLMLFPTKLVLVLVLVLVLLLLPILTSLIRMCRLLAWACWEHSGAGTSCLFMLQSCIFMCRQQQTTQSVDHTSLYTVLHSTTLLRTPARNKIILRS